MGSSHPVAQAELIPVQMVQAHQACKGHLFIDNSSVQDALIWGCTSSMASESMLWQCVSLDLVAGSRNWYARVSTASNIADGPSRGEFSKIAAMSYPTRVLPMPAI
eukprot:2270579-Amphidinium_carterae.1